MIPTIIASAALLAAPALAIGSANVINKCGYDVHLYAVPASGGGQSEHDQVLSSGGSYSQQWTSLSNGNGWSIKLCKDTSMSNIMQYEYTFHNDGTIWYDLSDVNGNPWDGNWEITATGSCTPRQAAYRFSTDDAYGMQSCPDSSSITVTLCSGTSGGSTPAKKHHHHHHHHHHHAKAVAPSVPAAQNSPWEAPSGQSWGLAGGKVEMPASEAPTPSTMATVASSHPSGGVTVTNVHTEYITHFVTASPAPAKRNEHLRHANVHA